VTRWEWEYRIWRIGRITGRPFLAIRRIWRSDGRISPTLVFNECAPRWLFELVGYLELRKIEIDDPETWARWKTYGILK